MNFNWKMYAGGPPTGVERRTPPFWHFAIGAPPVGRGSRYALTSTSLTFDDSFCVKKTLLYFTALKLKKSMTVECGT